MVEVLKSLIPNFSHFQEHFISSDGINIGFQSTLITSEGRPFAGGTADSLNVARRICAAEAIERATFLKLLKGSVSQRELLLLHLYPTTCGFAAGFENQSASFRAICEAIERWAWSYWIDGAHGISEVRPNLKTKLSQYYLKHFDEVIFFQCPLRLSVENRPKFVGDEFIFSVAVGVKDGGIFPGSRVTTTKDECWEHPLLEAWRHHLIFANELKNRNCKDLFDRRIHFFGENGRETLATLTKMATDEFPMARLRLIEQAARVEIDSRDRVYVWRALCEDYIGWDQGDETRFVY